MLWYTIGISSPDLTYHNHHSYQYNHATSSDAATPQTTFISWQNTPLSSRRISTPFPDLSTSLAFHNLTSILWVRNHSSLYRFSIASYAVTEMLHWYRSEGWLRCCLLSMWSALCRPCQVLCWWPIVSFYCHTGRLRLFVCTRPTRTVPVRQFCFWRTLCSCGKKLFGTILALCSFPFLVSVSPPHSHASRQLGGVFLWQQLSLFLWFWFCCTSSVGRLLRRTTSLELRVSWPSAGTGLVWLIAQLNPHGNS